MQEPRQANPAGVLATRYPLPDGPGSVAHPGIPDVGVPTGSPAPLHRARVTHPLPPHDAPVRVHRVVCRADPVGLTLEDQGIPRGLIDEVAAAGPDLLTDTLPEASDEVPHLR